MVLVWISWIAAILLIAATVTYISIKVTRFRTFAKTHIFLIAIAVLAFVSWISLNIALVGSGAEWYDHIFSSAMKAAKGFALSNEADKFYTVEQFMTICGDNEALAKNMQGASKVIVQYLLQAAQLLFASAAIVTSVYHLAYSKMHNLGVSFGYITGRHSRGCYSTNVLLTDLSYEHIKPFLENMAKNKTSKIKIIVPTSFYATQAGQELVEILKLNFYDAYVESVNRYVVKKFVKYKSVGVVNFYSMFTEDLSNLNFAKIANEFLQTKLGQKRKNAHKINFYISYQDEEFAKNYELEKESDNAIQLVNEYDWVACKFVYENPITRFIDIDYKDFAELNKSNGFGKLSINNTEPELHIHFFGFGNINSALLKRMFPNYQLPYDNQVHYHILDRAAATNHADKAFLASYHALNPMYLNGEYYPQYDFSKFFDATDVDFNNDDDFLSYIKKQVDHIYEVGKERAKHITNLIFIALGDMKANVQIANKARALIKNVSRSHNNILTENSYHKSFIIYPYVKDNDFFRRSPLDDYTVLTDLWDCNFDNIDNELAEAYKHEGYHKEFMGSHLYVFENKHSKAIDKKAFKKMIKEEYDNLKKELAALQKQIHHANKERDLIDARIKEISKVEPQGDKINELKGSLKNIEKLIKNKEQECAKLEEKIKKSKATVDEKEILNLVTKISRIRKAQFKREICPIVVIGRGGYISDPLRGMILEIAKHTNNNYFDVYSGFPSVSGIKSNDEIEKMLWDSANNRWLNTNYPKKQTNIGLALTIQSKLKFVNRELKWDRENISYKYTQQKTEKAKEHFREIYGERYRGYLIDSEEQLPHDLLSYCDFDINYGKYAYKDGFDLIKKHLSKEMLKRLNKYNPNGIKLEDIIKEFREEYQESFDKYLQDDKSVDEKISSMLIDYFFLTYLSVTNYKVHALTMMEHRRWYVESARYGVVPRLPSERNLNVDVDTKSSDDAANFCMTTSEGLLMYAKDTLKKMVKEGKIFAKPLEDGQKNRVRHRGTDIMAFSFNRDDPELDYLSDLYRVIFEYDLLAYQNTKMLCKIRKDSKYHQYHFIIRELEPAAPADQNSSIDSNKADKI